MDFTLIKLIFNSCTGLLTRTDDASTGTQTEETAVGTLSPGKVFRCNGQSMREFEDISVPPLDSLHVTEHNCIGIRWGIQFFLVAPPL